MNFKQMAEDNFDYLIAMRRDLHENPEPSLEEFRTTEKIEEKLNELGIPYRKLEPTGVIAEIKGGKPGKLVALRADIDALSITEKTDLPFKSKNDGFMHACGHDTHVSMLMTAAKMLNEKKNELQGTVRLIFQPAEEIAIGAKKTIEQGAIEGVDMIFGMHNFSQVPSGTLAVGVGATMAAADMIKIKVKGKAGHGAMPHTTVDATVAAAAVVMNLQTMVSREIPPSEAVVVTIGKLTSGSRFNIISGEATMEGTVRSFNREIHNSLPAMMKRIVENTAAAFNCEAEVEYNMMTEVLINDDTAAEYGRAAALKVAENETLVTNMQPTMGGEDFAEYTVFAPAEFIGLGVGGEYPIHSDYYVADENALKYGAAWYAQVAFDFLEQNA